MFESFRIDKTNKHTLVILITILVSMMFIGLAILFRELNQSVYIDQSQVLRWLVKINECLTKKGQEAQTSQSPYILNNETFAITFSGLVITGLLVGGVLTKGCYKKGRF